MAPNKRPKKIFYGWYILLVGMAGTFLASASSQLFVSIMLKPLTQEFGWSRTSITGAVTTATVLSGLVAFPLGKLADRYGPRFLTSAGALVTAGAYVALAHLTALWQFYLFFVTARVIATNTISGVVPKTTVINWFRRLRGRVMGFLSMSSPLGSALLVFVGQILMLRYGWQSVFIVIAIISVIFQAVPAVVILRRRPEDMGLMPDGGPAEKSIPTAAKPSLVPEVSWTLGQVIRTPTFWILILANMVAPASSAGVGFHLMAYFTDMGIAATVAVGAVSIYALSGALGSLMWGVLSERIAERFLAIAMMTVIAAAILFLQTVRTHAGVFLFAMVFGATCRGEGTLFNMITAQYYGRESFGAISGFIVPFHRLGLGMGPLVSSVCFDLFGSYRMVFNVFVVICILTALMLTLAKKPARDGSSSSGPNVSEGSWKSKVR